MTSKIILSLGLSAALLAPTFVDAATIAYWRMEADNDAGAGLNVANEVGGAPALTAAAASLSSDVFGSSVPLTGDANAMSSTLDTPTTAATWPALEGLTSTTIEFWLNETRGKTFGIPVRFSNAGNPGLSRGFIFRDTTNFYVAYATPSMGGGVGTQLLSGVNVTDGWHHIAFTYDQASAVGNLYIDGDLKATDTGLPGTPLRFTAPGQDLTFGADSTLGSIDEFRISDVALDPSQFLNANAIPEPTSMALMGLGLLALYGRRRS